MPPARFPIIYVRGYAGAQSDVEQTVDDPYYGFNLGSTHVHPDADGRAVFFGFESPLVRLMKDWEYSDVYVAGNQRQGAAPRSVNPLSIWIFRYYDPTSETFTEPTDSRRLPGYTSDTQERLSIEKSAELLALLIDDVLCQTGAERVILIAHSMGGLVCRSLLEKHYLETKRSGSDFVDKLLTFGTPHGGIHFAVGGGSIEWIRDRFGVNSSDDFGPRRMFQFLTPGAGTDDRPPKDFDPREMSGAAFPLDRVFCIVGTNAKDYDVAAGMSRRTVGPDSDGLVQIQQAAVNGAHRAHIHRSHSGRYGMVNSEEGYQNLQRFLFGDLKVETALAGITSLPLDSSDKSYHAEVRLTIRQLPVLVDEQSLAHFCAVPLVGSGGNAYRLFTAFLIPKFSAAADNATCRYSLRLAVHCLSKKNGLLDLSTHLEQVPVWSDYLIVDITPPSPGQVTYAGKYQWRSLIGNDVPADSFEPQRRLELQEQSVTIALPANGRRLLGGEAHVRFTVSDGSERRGPVDSLSGRAAVRAGRASS